MTPEKKKRKKHMVFNTHQLLTIRARMGKVFKNIKL